jgi:hypothetical protein
MAAIDPSFQGLAVRFRRGARTPFRGRLIPGQCCDRDGEASSASSSSGVMNQIAVRGPGSPFRGPPFTNEVQIKNRGEPGVACCRARSSAVFQAFNCFFVSIDFPFFTSAVAPSRYSVLPGSNIAFEPSLS